MIKVIFGTKLSKYFTKEGGYYNFLIKKTINQPELAGYLVPEQYTQLSAHLRHIKWAPLGLTLSVNN